MRINQYKRKNKVDELDFEKIVTAAKYYSYNYASRYLNVTIDSLKKYMQEKYPDLHNQILENGINAKRHKYTHLKVKCNAK